MSKPDIQKLSVAKATSIVKEIVRTSHSEEEIRTRLNEAGFDGKDASVSTTSSGEMFMAAVMVWGPNFTVIHA